MSNQPRILMLRGVNLGAHNRISMPDLRAMFEDDGLDGVRTYVQSGNVVLSSERSPAELEQRAEQLISQRFGLAIQVLARTGEELAEVVARNPLGDVVTEPKRYQVSFLSAVPEPVVVERLRARAHASERLVAIGRELYAWHPEGIGSSKLGTALAGKAIGVRATARNWTTVLALLAMAQEL